MAILAEKVVDISKELFDYNGKVVHRSSKDQDYLKDVKIAGEHIRSVRVRETGRR